ncbi:transcription regulator protein BACH1b isoform X2 [Siniperca chuatsi]|uniref:transcription regulator protein BACH1b isoform X2 n=1 Tax=Siniperca chuatsi TaxID=119488 RepID=UPI001CE1D85D|nr:transcription regulator protein BACH1b isoform X2 [Siniperca chuatsi]XP_044078891.1 transcription regulator protein BACH1b isoform X2 [Siniperca chuatsi]XP_044078892.1 transcription regulator protein BACH1b isoform X2 [Siniperca chuatsi]
MCCAAWTSSVAGKCCVMLQWWWKVRVSEPTAQSSLPVVTVAGFEPLLKFAYTSKLLFGKDDVLEIRNSASILGFRDLDEACFDFLLPKFFSSSKGSAPFLRKTCCKKKCKRRLSKEDHGVNSDYVLLDEKEVKPVADSPSQQEVAWLCNKSVNNKMGSQNSAGTLTPVAEGTNDYFMLCPKYRRQLACGKKTCVTEKRLNNPDLACSPPSSSANSKNETEVEFPENSTSNPSRQSKGGADDPWKTEIHDTKTEAGMGRAEFDMVKRDRNKRQGKWSEKERDMDTEEDISFSDRSNVKAVPSGPSTVLGERSSELMLHHCPLKTFGEGPAITGSLGHERFVMDITEDKNTRDSGVLAPVSLHQKAEEQVEAERKRADDEIDSGWQERGKGGQTGSLERAALCNTVEREVSNASSSQLNFQDPDAGSSSDTGSGRAQSTSLECLKLQINLSSASNSCPFFQDLDQSKCLWKGAELSECEGVFQSGVSSLNSGEDGDSETETEGDSDTYTRERARQVQLPFSVDWIVDLSRNDFQQLLKQQVFTHEQLELVHDMRRRSKNRLAAQRCRKRKLDCIYNLQCEINKLKTEREKLIMEKSQLNQLKLKTCQNVSALCQRVCNEANLQPEQLQVLAKYTSPDCPLSSFFPYIDALLSQPGLPLQLQASLSACSAGLDKYMAAEEASSSSRRDTVTGDGQHSL